MYYHQVDASLKDTTVVECYKDNKKIDVDHSGNPTVSCEYCDHTEDDKDDFEGDQRTIRHPNNSITIEGVRKEDVGSYSCKVITGVGAPLGNRLNIWHQG